MNCDGYFVALAGQMLACRDPPESCLWLLLKPLTVRSTAHVLYCTTCGGVELVAACFSTVITLLWFAGGSY